MFTLTFLGNHSWLVESGGCRLLIDPTLTQRYGPTAAEGIQIYPPRQIELAAMPPIDAVFISHEHEGHFELPTLAQLDRRIPIYLSVHCSIAARQILAELGFVVHLARPGQPVSLGALTFVPAPGDQTGMEVDEWDNLGILVFDQDQHGNFFSTIDNAPRQADITLAQQYVSLPGIWALSANETDGEFGCANPGPPPPLLQRKVEEACALANRHEETWGHPALTLVVGGGYSFTGAHDWLNETVFPIRHEQLADTVAALVPGLSICWPLPGQRFHMRGGALVEVDKAPWVHLLPREAWPPRGFGKVLWLEDFAPISGQTTLPEGELQALQDELQGLAEHLYDRTPFHRLYSLSHSAVGGREPTLALVLRDGDGAFVYAYEPQSCGFVPVNEPDPISRYAIVFEAWASDMLGVLRCELANHALSAGHSRLWLVDANLFSVNRALLQYLTPTRFPERYLRRYREEVRREEVDRIGIVGL